MKETEEERIAPPVMLIDNISISYGDDKYAVKNVSAKILGNSITAIMGPSGCGKTTLLRAINRMHELYPNIHTKGKIWLNGNNIYDMPTINLRRKIGMVFQRPNPFPTLSIFDNVIAGYKLNGIHLKKSEREEIVETSLKDVALWDEVKDSLHSKGNFLSGGQQQRLCIARTIAFRPEVILLDEPTSALDPISTAKIEDLLVGLKKNYTIIMVTHNMSQAARISDKSMFMYLGELVEYDNTQKMFTTPSDPRTEAYLTGKFG
ncbi:MAG: phosphate ABC transporter ATP-binding protein PstB [Prevotella sp.]|jgi:phosphate transport system ATP-binding protein|nr:MULTISPECIES: phosphate ABC transporter ATP-binding protein PstB [unclassified Prevotella]MCH3969169.1 phosphate ABC transporter ATP-binding protein PstB [Prevotella sp.]MCH3985808.1 phosphate ABC transporter ATP-binding protein PstB [Prevotella sp.]MCH4017446.1 phosphate ABC transporter ATP-binding protein PstB [Prevotella sp.]MCH4186105.1 phosphate ABC transporter ATP-binding protein PstB [Prevotella sp.]MCH4215940.1 phosphate ABC transporter ATP-binding protein PstB [Prevotella sp.]